MTTQEWFEADQDDADRVRAWAAQDAQEPDTERAVDYLAHQNGVLSAENTQLIEALRESRTATGHAWRHGSEAESERDEARAERDAAWATIARMTLDVTP